MEYGIAHRGVNLFLTQGFSKLYEFARLLSILGQMFFWVRILYRLLFNSERFQKIMKTLMV